MTADGKASERLWLEEFKWMQPSKRKGTLKNVCFKFDGPENDIEWIGQLKPLHAQRIGADISEGLSRVGFDEPEWLRLLCER